MSANLIGSGMRWRHAIRVISRAVFGVILFPGETYIMFLDSEPLKAYPLIFPSSLTGEASPTSGSCFAISPTRRLLPIPIVGSPVSIPMKHAIPQCAG